MGEVGEVGEVVDWGGGAPGRVVSVVDPESRHVHKSRNVYRDGCEARVGAEPDTGLINGVELTAGDTVDDFDPEISI